MRVLLDGGTRIEGTNAVGRSLDFADPAPLALLLERGADPNSLVSGSTHPLIWAINRERSAAHVKMLLGSDPDELPRYVIIEGRKEEFPEEITALLLNE